MNCKRCGYNGIPYIHENLSGTYCYTCCEIFDEILALGLGAAKFQEAVDKFHSFEMTLFDAGDIVEIFPTGREGFFFANGTKVDHLLIDERIEDVNRRRLYRVVD